MAWRCTGASNAALVENMAREGIIKSAVVKEAFLKGALLPLPPLRGLAPGHRPRRHHLGAAHARVRRRAPARPPGAHGNQPRPRVLDVGSGSGYLTHVLAELVGPRGVVVGVEHIRELRDLGAGNMAKSEEGRQLLESGRVKFVVGDGRKGWKDEQDEQGGDGWDAIHVGASAREVHPELVAQLRAPGRMFIPVDDVPGSPDLQHIWVVDKDAEGGVSSRKLFGVRYVPLTDSPP
ncbi:protein-L-isoaspartate O-methyltransferase [Magnaporthiopsis poae ATCC 64411]|uniref:protein-L-isoaspartate(D-aspartate) O-methyltransferase n=1 Tax=Magnaporthiopsis poae (strain ATCC 64411 / 73-15) TaxID=644358 RepID=A0A0C4DUP2_MAGP6|nr:protein-L-isoaspartate O-methyltransferase [Magnaporthiopsis poae ATCC 64411]